MDSKTGLIIQFTGVFLIAVLSVFLRRSLKTRASTFWTAAWLMLSFALFCLGNSFFLESFPKLFLSGYFISEYLFGFFLIAGCYALDESFKFSNFHKLLFLPFLIAGLILPWTANDFNLIFNLHSLILSFFFLSAFFALGKSPIKSFGWKLMRTLLVILAIDFFHYFIVFSMLKFQFELPILQSYLAFNPIIDLVLEIQLAFGMVIVLLEQVLKQARSANKKLIEAHRKLEQTAQTDPLTTAFNRHAFHGFLKNKNAEQGKISGCVGFFDIDDLKPINDLYGHTVGDMAIRAVVTALRQLVRAEDLIYRWGGDEFFVVMVSMNSEMAEERMGELDILLTEKLLVNTEVPLTIGVSYGFSDFEDISQLEQSAEAADKEMYRRKLERKRNKVSPVFYDPNAVRSSQPFQM